MSVQTGLNAAERRRQVFRGGIVPVVGGAAGRQLEQKPAAGSFGGVEQFACPYPHKPDIMFPVGESRMVHPDRHAVAAFGDFGQKLPAPANFRLRPEPGWRRVSRRFETARPDERPQFVEQLQIIRIAAGQRLDPELDSGKFRMVVEQPGDRTDESGSPLRLGGTGGIFIDAADLRNHFEAIFAGELEEPPGLFRTAGRRFRIERHVEKADPVPFQRVEPLPERDVAVRVCRPAAAVEPDGVFPPVEPAAGCFGVRLPEPADHAGKGGEGGRCKHGPPQPAQDGCGSHSGRTSA